MPRKKVPLDVRRQVLMESGYRCGVPTCRNILAVDLHHIIPVSEEGGNDPDNLIALCGLCHDLYHRGEIPIEAIRYWKGILVALNNAFDRDTIDLLLFLWKVRTDKVGVPLRLSGDGVLKFARLIAAGLVAPFQWVATYTGGAAYGVKLTQRGQVFVDAWMRGDRSVSWYTDD